MAVSPIWVKNMVVDKSSLRREIRSRLDRISVEQRRTRSRQIVEQLSQLPAFCQTSVVYAYYPTKTEVDLRPLLEKALAAGKIVALPRVEQKTMMRFYRITTLADVHSGAYDIMEPNGNELISAPGLMLVPGLAFTADGRRLGHGGGYYDRYLAEHQDLETVAAAFHEQMMADLSTEVHDRKMDHIVQG